jgi:hypothetical protein
MISHRDNLLMLVDESLQNLLAKGSPGPSILDLSYFQGTLNVKCFLTILSFPFFTTGFPYFGIPVHREFETVDTAYDEMNECMDSVALRCNVEKLQILRFSKEVPYSQQLT